MKVTLFTKEQLLNGYLDVYGSGGPALQKFWELSVVMHGLDTSSGWDDFSTSEYGYVGSKGKVLQEDDLAELSHLKKLSLKDLL